MPTDRRDRLREKRDGRHDRREGRRDARDDRTDQRREDRQERHETGISRWDQNAIDGTGLGSGNTKEVFYDAAQTIADMIPDGFGEIIPEAVGLATGYPIAGLVAGQVFDMFEDTFGTEEGQGVHTGVPLPGQVYPGIPIGKPFDPPYPWQGDTGGLPIATPVSPPSFGAGGMLPGSSGLTCEQKQAMGMKIACPRPKPGFGGGGGGFGLGAGTHGGAGHGACTCKKTKPKPPPLSCLEKAKIRCMKTELIKDLEKSGLFCAMKKPKKVPPKKKPLCRPRSSIKKKKSTAGSKKKKAKSSTKKKTATKKKKTTKAKRPAAPRGGIMNTCFR